VRLEIYNLLGQRVETLVNAEQAAGLHQVDWSAERSDGTSLASGIYFYRLEAGDIHETRKMLLMK
jgi:flagellar hook assembly protein FlgD